MPTPRSRLLLPLLPLFLSACASAPMTPAEHRQAAQRGQSFFTSESFEVKRPFAEVAKTFKKMAPECLSFSLAETRKPIIGVGSTTQVYGKAKPTVLASDKKAELHFQMQFKNTVGAMPDGGMYYLIADAYPTGKGTTRVDMYWLRVKLVAEAVKGWASGENLGCPDAARIF